MNRAGFLDKQKIDVAFTMCGPSVSVEVKLRLEASLFTSSHITSGWKCSARVNSGNFSHVQKSIAMENAFFWVIFS